MENRPDGCVISKEYLGGEWSIIKVIDNRVIVAGATAAITKKLLNEFVEEYLGIAEENEVGDAHIPRALFDFTPTFNAVTSFKIAGNDISDYILAYDKQDKVVNKIHPR